MTTHERHRNLSSLSRRPVLIALLVYSVAYGAATFAVWRETTSVSNHQECEKHYLVQRSGSAAGGSETAGSMVYRAVRHFLI